MRKHWFIIVTVALVLLFSGCAFMDALKKANTPENREKAGNAGVVVGGLLKGAAGILAPTPLAPLAGVMGIAGSIIAGIGIVLRKTGTRKGVLGTMENNVIVRSAGLLDSRKTKIQGLASLIYAALVVVRIYWPEAMSDQLVGILVAGIGWIAGKNIEGIATEDAATKAAEASVIAIKDTIARAPATT